ncbi:MCE family protein [Rhodococcus gannanensis]|uniref:MCE family protein n=1 Tax=Rhodococcus gannanensis TaxID=1960308 RepID=A0ABW4NY59_9NOCA
MRGGAAAALLAVAVAVSGCGWRGVESLPLPATEGRGDDAFTVTVELPDVSTITPNSRVMVDDVTVGSVTDIGLGPGHAVLTVGLNGDVDLPANATARIGQTSLLGSTHVELSAPADEPPTGRLTDGSRITLDRAGAYPTTEETLSSLSLVLGGSGLAQVEEIMGELNAALGGREDTVRRLLARLDTMLATLDDQKSDITRTIDGLDVLAGEVAEGRDDVVRAINGITPALDTIATRRADLVRALDSLGRLGESASAVVTSTGDDLTANLRSLQPVLEALADSGPSLTESLRYLLTYPFPIDTYQNAVRGDYANGEVTLDLRNATLDRALLLGTPLQGRLAGPEGVVGALAPATATTTEIALPDLGRMLFPAVTPGGTP